MSTKSGEVGATPAQTFASALQQLHRKAGKPSARRLALEIGTVSHTTVAEALSGRRIPSWPVVASVVQQLGGVEAKFRWLWAAATNESPAPTEHEREDSTFLTRYRELIAEYFGTLRIPNIERQYRTRFDEVFVSPRLVKEADVSSVSYPSSVDVAEFDKQIRRTVLLGDPGSGKSALCQKLMLLHATREDLDPPFLVPLREFAADFPPSRSVVGFIENRLEAVFQNRPPQGMVERQLVGGSTLVIFDGLDEVLNTTQRAEVASIIELFSAEYRFARVLITSRITGYSEAGLNPREFVTYRILEFDNTQLKEYAHRWFGQDSNLSAVEAGTLAETFLRESADLSDLRRSPLLIALLCAFYRETQNMPRRKPQVYERLAALMFERWDMSRGIEIPTHCRLLVAPVLRNLAFKMLTEGQREISEDDFLRTTREFLEEKFKSSDQAEESAQELLNLFRRRAWVLTNAGTRPDGQKSYRFFHRTFMEYLVAQQLVRSFRQPEQVAQEIISRISMPQWIESGKLAVQLMDQSVERGAARVVDLLIDQSEKLDSDRRSLVLDFLIKTSEVTDLPKPVVRRLAEATDWPYAQESLELDSDLWTTSSNVPSSVSDALDRVRALLRQSHATPESALVAVTWIWATFEASLRGCLPLNDEYPDDLVDTAIGYKLLTVEEAHRLDQVYRLRSSVAHAQLPSKVAHGSAVQAVKTVYDAIIAIYDRVAEVEKEGELAQQERMYASSSVHDTQTAFRPIKLVDYFHTLLSEMVDLRKVDLEFLDERVESIYSALVADPVLGRYLRRRIYYGSWAHKTIIKPLPKEECDVDILVRLDEHPQWSAEPGRYIEEVYAALGRNAVYKDMHRIRKSRCVRLTYGDLCRVDIAPYFVLSDGRQVIVNWDGNKWEETNPNGFTQWVRDKDKITDGNLRRVIRLLKFLRGNKESLRGTRSIILTTLIANMVDEGKKVGDPGYYADVPTTLRNVTQDLDVWLQQNAARPSIKDPSMCDTTLDHRWDDATYDNFRDKMHSYAVAINEAYQETAQARSVELWQDIFGCGFKAPPSKQPSRLLTSRACPNRSG